MRRIASLFASAVLALAVCEGLAQTADVQAQVARALEHDLGINVQHSPTQFGMQVLGSKVRVPEHASLHVAAAHPVPGAGAWLLRIECSSRIQCIPFEVVLHGRGSGSPKLPHSGGTQSLEGDGGDLTAPLVRTGQRVLLAENVSGMHLSAPAVCLQAGILGQRIRVRNVSSGRVVLARVRAAGQVAVED